MQRWFILNINQILEDLKNKYENEQKFETITIEELPLSPDENMISFMAYGENDKKLSVFSVVCQNNDSIRLISSKGNTTYEAGATQQIITDMQNILSERILAIKEYLKNNTKS